MIAAEDPGDEPVAGSEDNAVQSKPQSNGQVLANVTTSEPDGPSATRRWRHNGQLITEYMRLGSWEMVNYLWELPNKTADVLDLLEPVYGDRNKRITKGAFPSFCKHANRFFEKHNIPWRATINRGSVTLTVVKKLFI